MDKENKTRFNKTYEIESKRQFLASYFGDKKLEEILKAFDIFCQDNNIAPFLLKDLATYYRLVKLFPVE